MHPILAQEWFADNRTHFGEKLLGMRTKSLPGCEWVMCHACRYSILILNLVLNLVLNLIYF